MSDIKQIQDFIQTTKMSKDEVFSLIMTLQNKEVSLDKSSQKTYALAVEEEDFLNKCSKNRGINPDTKKVVCPHCGSTNTVGNGSKKGRSRYLCRDCQKSFGDTIGTVMYRSKLPIETWKKLIEKTLNGSTIREIVRDLHISSNTALYNRHRICSVLMQLVNNTDDFPSIAEGDEYYLPLSFKGEKDPSFFIEKLGRMPYLHCSREERYEYMKNYLDSDLPTAIKIVDKLEEDEKECNEELKQFFTDKEVKYPYLLSLALNKMEKPKVFEVLKTLDEQQKKKRGISNQQVCILSCVDKHSNHFLKPVCVGRIEPRHIEDNLVPHLTNETILVTDSHRAYKTVANRHKIPLRQIPSGKHKSNGFSLGHINGYHSNISRFFKKYREVASKYVDLYLALFYWKEKHKDFETEQQNTEILNLLSRQADRTYIHDFKFKSMPFDMKGILDS